MNKDSERQHPLNISWRSLLDASQAGLFLLDPHFRIIWANKLAGKLRKKTVGSDIDDIGKSFPELVPESRRNLVTRVLNKVLQGEAQEYEVAYPVPDKTLAWFQVHYTPIPGDDGTLNYICITVNDITLLKEKEQRLHATEQRWKFALEGAGNGVWEYDFETGESYYSPYYKQMLGYTDADFPNETSQWRDRIHPDDQALVFDIDAQYLSGQIEKHSIEYRLQHCEGHYIWVVDKGMLLEKTTDDRPLKVIGTNKDISARKSAEEKLVHSERRFVSFMDNSPTMTWIMDDQHVFHYMNKPYLKAFGLTEKDIGRSMYEIFPKNICDGFAANNNMVWEKNVLLETIEEGRGPNGAQQYYQIFKFPLQNAGGLKLLGGVALDITERINCRSEAGSAKGAA